MIALSIFKQLTDDCITPSLPRETNKHYFYHGLNVDS